MAEDLTQVEPIQALSQVMALAIAVVVLLVLTIRNITRKCVELDNRVQALQDSQAKSATSETFLMHLEDLQQRILKLESKLHKEE